MQLTIFGEYGPYEKAGCACSCYLLEINGRKILMDIGSGSLGRVMADLEVGEIDALLLSHLHADHTTDLGILGYALDVWNQQNHCAKKLPLYLPAEPKKAYDYLADDTRFELHTVQEGRFTVCGISCEAKQMSHPVLSYGYRFHAEKTFVFTGDTRLHDGLSGFIRNADFVLSDAAFLDAELTETSPHLSAGQIARLASESGAAKLMLTHIRPYTQKNDLLNEAAQYFDHVFIANQGETITI